MGSRLLRAGLRALVALSPAFAVAAPAHAASLPASGPPILHAPAAVAPQLQNRGVWRAAPILVSGADAYRKGEFLYQGFLYDDHGAKEQQDPSDPRQNNQFSGPNGTYTYPSDPRYADDAADLVELRVKPLPSTTAFRLTLNTVKDPSLIAFSIAIGGTSQTPHPFPFGANVSAPADLFLTVHPAGRSLVGVLQHADGTPVAGPAPTVAVDQLRRQIEVRVPHADWDPGRGIVRLAAGVGLWNATAKSYLLPASERSATTPGGAGLASKPAAFFDVAFRTHEPVVVASDSSALTNPGWWRDRQQGAALAANDISPLYADVDFGKLAHGATDDSGVPTTGPIDRIMASHFEPAQGVDYSSSCYQGDFHCQYQGQLEPYALYVPPKPPPAAGYGTTLLLHANAANYNEFLGSRNAQQFGDRGTGSLVLTPQARDPGSSYTGLGAVDVFEAWADVARHYKLNPAWTDISGYSLGGLGTFKLGEQFPDLFARAVAIVGSPGSPGNVQPESAEMASLRNLPIMIWDSGPVDELNPGNGANAAAALQQLGYRYDYLLFPGEHLTPAINDQYAPAAAFLGTDLVDPDPAHVTYVYAKDFIDGLVRASGDFPEYGLVADHSYWISGIRLRTAADTCRTSPTPGCESTGSVDAISSGFGQADPVASGPLVGAGVLPAGTYFPALPYTEVRQTWSAPAAQARADTITLTTTNISALTIDPKRAHVDCRTHVDLQADGPVQVTLAGCGGRSR